MMDSLGRVDETRPVTNRSRTLRAEACRTSPSTAGDADVIDEPPPEAIATAVDQEQPPPRLEDTVHLGDGTVLMRVVVEAIRACHHVEGAGRERELLAVPLDRGDA